MNSIRSRLNLSIIGGLLVVLTAAAIFLYVSIARQVESIFDQALFDRAQALIALTELDNNELEFDFSDEGMMPEFVDADNLQYYQLWLNSTELLKSPSLGESSLPLLNLEAGQHRFSNLSLPDNRQGRLIEINFLPRVDTGDPVWELDDDEDEWEPHQVSKPEPVNLVLARERETLNASLWGIALTILVVMSIVTVSSGYMIKVLTGKGLAPLARFARQVSEIDESRLDTRINTTPEPSVEIAPIEAQLNHLLERIQSAFEREKRFSSNVAHELRTPLSELKTLAEVAAMIPDDPDQINAFFKDVAGVSSQMERIVVTLLELARSDAGLLRIDPEDIELADFCQHIWRNAVHGLTDEKTLIAKIPPNLVINTDREKLGMILTNLFVNAISYSPEKAQIEIESVIRNGRVVIEVKNASVDLKPEDVLHMRDRFWRKQNALGEFGHSGLGLSLVEALAKIMNLDVNLNLDQSQVFRVSISGLSPAPAH